jgi:Tol biopolymer transport system component/DNA-binding winged helix-turn-helix (wHTH) protein
VKVPNIPGRNAEEVLFGPFRFEPGNGLWRGDLEVPLPPRALGVLMALVAQPGVVVSKQQLMDAVWKDAFVTEASLLEAVRVLREALGDDRLKPTFIQTVHRRGYRFVAQLHTNARAEPPATESQVATGGWHGVAEHWRPFVITGFVTAVASVSLALVFAIYGQRPPEVRPTVRFTIALPENTAIDPLRGSVAVSPDGMRMLYVALHAGRPRLFLRTVDRDTPQLLEGSDGAADPFFSPDGEWVGFFAHGSLKKLRLTGGTPVTLCAARAGAGATWLQDSTIVFGGGPSGALARVSDQGGEPVVLAKPSARSRELAFGWPDALPDMSAVIFTATSLAGSRVALLDLASGTSQTLIPSSAFGRYSPTGHIVFERRGRLEAVPFSLRERTVSDAPRPILRGIATGDPAQAGPRYAFSRTGSLVYVPGTSLETTEQLHWLNVRGAMEPVPLPAVPIDSVDIAPDLRQLAMSIESDVGADLWVGDVQRGAVSKLSTDGNSVSPAWHPGGLEIAFAYSKAGPFNLFTRPADRDAAPRPLIESEWNQVPTSWSPDGRRLAFTEYHPLTGADVWIVDVVTRQRRQVVRTLFDESNARFSPDGRWLAYMTNESGRWDVFIRPAEGGGPRVQVSTDGGAWPAWSVDGRTLYFSANGRVAATSVDTSSGLTVSAPIVIPVRDDLQPATGRADADRILVRRRGVAPARHELRVVLEWFTELTRLVRLPA